jgi:hypothetical protein
MRTEEIRQLVSSAIEEDAQKDLDFGGNRAIDALNITDEQKAHLKAALLFYAQSAAIRTLGILRLHNLLPS